MKRKRKPVKAVPRDRKWQAHLEPKGRQKTYLTRYIDEELA